ncbi:MAG: response regulator transcription factor [Bacteroidota bacterium]
MKNKIHVVIADDHALIRDGYRALFHNDERIFISAEAENGQDLIQLLVQNKTDIVLLDHEMPVMNGLASIQVINANFPQIKVIVVTIHDNTKIRNEYLKHGAKAFISKGCNASQMRSTILEVYEGNQIKNKAPKPFIEDKLEFKSKSTFCVKLTPMEQEIIQQIGMGRSNIEIAKDLGIAIKTVNFHKNNIYTKTGTHNSAGIVLFAIQNKIHNPKT